MREAWLGLAAIGALAHPDRALAQVVGNYFDPVPLTVGGAANDATSRQARGLYDVSGIAIGGFTVRPDLTTGLGYDSSVNATPNGEGSTLLDTHLKTDVTSDWARDSLAFNADVDDRRYLDLPRQSFTEWSTRVLGALDVGDDVLSATYSHLNLYEQPGALNAITTAEPVPFRLDTGQLSYALTGIGRFSFTPDISVTGYHFDDFTAGGQTYSQAYRNRLAIQGELVSRYELAPQRDVVLVLRATNLSYATGTAATPKRNSNGGAALAGLDYPAPASNFRFRVLAGVQVRQYVSSAYSGQVDPIVEASVIWTPTRLTTATLLARRDIEDAQAENIASYVANSVTVSAVHELRRNLRLNGFVKFEQATYQSATIHIAVPTLPEAGNAQTIFSTGAGVTWLLSRHVRALLNYGFSRGSGEGGSTYVANTGFIGLNFRW